MKVMGWRSAATVPCMYCNIGSVGCGRPVERQRGMGTSPSVRSASPLASRASVHRNANRARKISATTYTASGHSRWRPASTLMAA